MTLGQKGDDDDEEIWEIIMLEMEIKIKMYAQGRQVSQGRGGKNIALKCTLFWAPGLNF